MELIRIRERIQKELVKALELNQRSPHIELKGYIEGLKRCVDMIDEDYEDAMTVTSSASDFVVVTSRN